MTASDSEEQLDRMRRYVAKGTPHGEAIGLHLDNVLPNKTWLSLPHQPFFVADPKSGILHGGIITTLLDHACGMAVHFTHGVTTQAIATLDLRIDYMRATTGTSGLKAYAHCYKVTRNIAFVRGIAYENDETDLIAHCAATFMLAANRSNLEGTPSTLLEDPEPEGTGGIVPPSDQPSPYMRFLGIVPSRDSSTTAIMPFQTKLVGNPVLPALHGGVIGALMESAAISEMQTVLEPGALAKPVNLTVNYIRSGRAVNTYAFASVARRGRRVLGFNVEAWQRDRSRPIATAFGHFLARPDNADRECVDPTVVS